MTTRAQWAAEFLTAGGWQPTPENVLAVVTWATAEGSTATCNPLDTTLGGFAGETDYNSVGVKNYPDKQTGITATLDTLAVNAYGYPAIRSALEAGSHAEDVCAAIDASAWGTHGTSQLVASIRQAPQPSYDTPVAGTAPEPTREVGAMSEQSTDEPGEVLPHPGLNAAVIAAVGTPTGGGYWEFGADGGVFAFGDAVAFPDDQLPSTKLSGPIVAGFCTPTGRGVTLVGSDGGIFCYGDAQYHGSLPEVLAQRQAAGQ